MDRLRRFENHRYVGLRDTMTVYDCDAGAEFIVLAERFASDDLMGRNLLQTFGPDSLAEARNRGFSPAG